MTNNFSTVHVYGTEYPLSKEAIAAHPGTTDLHDRLYAMLGIAQKRKQLDEWLENGQVTVAAIRRAETWEIRRRFVTTFQSVSQGTIYGASVWAQCTKTSSRYLPAPGEIEPEVGQKVLVEPFPKPAFQRKEFDVYYVKILKVFPEDRRPEGISIQAIAKAAAEVVAEQAVA